MKGLTDDKVLMDKDDYARGIGIFRVNKKSYGPSETANGSTRKPTSQKTGTEGT